MEGPETPENLMGHGRSPNSSWTRLHKQKEQGEALADAYPDPLKTWRGESPTAALPPHGEKMAYLPGELGL